MDTGWTVGAMDTGWTVMQFNGGQANGPSRIRIKCSSRSPNQPDVR